MSGSCTLRPAGALRPLRPLLARPSLGSPFGRLLARPALPVRRTPRSNHGILMQAAGPPVPPQPQPPRSSQQGEETFLAKMARFLQRGAVVGVLVAALVSEGGGGLATWRSLSHTASSVPCPELARVGSQPCHSQPLLPGQPWLQPAWHLITLLPVPFTRPFFAAPERAASRGGAQRRAHGRQLLRPQLRQVRCAASAALCVRWCVVRAAAIVPPRPLLDSTMLPYDPCLHLPRPPVHPACCVLQFYGCSHGGCFNGHGNRHSGASRSQHCPWDKRPRPLPLPLRSPVCCSSYSRSYGGGSSYGYGSSYSGTSRSYGGYSGSVSRTAPGVGAGSSLSFNSFFLSPFGFGALVLWLFVFAR